MLTDIRKDHTGDIGVMLLQVMDEALWCLGETRRIDHRDALRDITSVVITVVVIIVVVK